MKIYIAGPMTGIPFHNWPAFDKAAAALRQRGHEPISPADLDRAWGYTPPADGTIDRKTYVGFLKNDLLNMLGHAEALFMLPGWSQSNGAAKEHKVAGWLDFPVFYRIEDVPIRLGGPT